MQFRRNPDVGKVIADVASRMHLWGITIPRVAMEMGVSRQYVWQIIHYASFVSPDKVEQLKSVVERIIAKRRGSDTLGERLRAARVSAGLTLKDVASKIGYSWVAVERWELNVCRPKPGVLWHLCSVYNISWDWISECLPIEHTFQTVPTPRMNLGALPS